MQDNFNNAQARSSETSSRLAEMAQSRQKFTNKEYSRAMRDMRRAEDEAERQRKAAKDASKWGLVGQLAGVAGGLAFGAPGAMIGGALGIGAGALGGNGMNAARGASGPLMMAAMANQRSGGLLGGQSAASVAPTAPLGAYTPDAFYSAHGAADPYMMQMLQMYGSGRY